MDQYQTRQMRSSNCETGRGWYHFVFENHIFARNNRENVISAGSVNSYSCWGGPSILSGIKSVIVYIPTIWLLSTYLCTDPWGDRNENIYHNAVCSQGQQTTQGQYLRPGQEGPLLWILHFRSPHVSQKNKKCILWSTYGHLGHQPVLKAGTVWPVTNRTYTQF